MSKWIRLLTLTLLVGVTKAHHIMRLVILAGLGLAGLYMLQNMMKDFNKIFANFQGNRPVPALIKSILFKRSVNNSDYFQNEDAATDTSNETPRIDWELILSRDPVECVRSFACQLSAVAKIRLSKDESDFLWLIRTAVSQNNWASNQIYDAMNYGQKSSSESRCRKRYKYCPFSSKTMLSLMKLL